MLPRGDPSIKATTAGMLALPLPPLGKLSAAQRRLAFGLALACDPADMRQMTDMRQMFRSTKDPLSRGSQEEDPTITWKSCAT